MQVEQRAYPHPWTRGNFLDSLQSGYHIPLLFAQQAIVGYFVAMPGVQEAHLLNFTIAPEWQHQGWARTLMAALCSWARQQQAETLWLEVRASNHRAQQVYQASGFVHVGLRKDYYPCAHGARENAVVMSLML